MSNTWDDWQDAFERSYDRLPEAPVEICPSCGLGKVSLAYMVKNGSSAGSVFVWCDSCLKGIVISRAEVPEGVTPLEFGSPESGLIPNFSVVPPVGRE
ncbi:hypothetical protein ACIQF6_17275 [Kitasatospora sp. NPDC092948]|uniref:hypothetical protein n=1 Tax=Kitasatospora sp. NPDC092948 TaxID=3364088 RepID=UPI00380899C3